jgi:hypothetical protein
VQCIQLNLWRCGETGTVYNLLRIAFTPIPLRSLYDNFQHREGREVVRIFVQDTLANLEYLVEISNGKCYKDRKTVPN